MSKTIVYNFTTYKVVKRTETERGAKISASRMSNKTGQDVRAIDINELNKVVVPMKTVKNLMTGEEVQIPVNTPRSCDPSSEAYWSM